CSRRLVSRHITPCLSCFGLALARLSSRCHTSRLTLRCRFLIKVKVCSSAGPISIGHFFRLGLEGGTSLGQLARWRLVRQARIGRFCYDLVAFLQAGSWDSFAGP